MNSAKEFCLGPRVKGLSSDNEEITTDQDKDAFMKSKGLGLWSIYQQSICNLEMFVS